MNMLALLLACGISPATLAALAICALNAWA